MKWILNQLYGMRSELKFTLSKNWLSDFEININIQRQREITEAIMLIEKEIDKKKKIKLMEYCTKMQFDHRENKR